MRLRFALPVFLGSALLFCLEPMLGRALLPHFGGTASVWTMCLASYQLLLLAGALYADRLGRAPSRTQYRVHLAALALAALWAALFAVLRRPLCALIPTGQGVLAECAAAVACVAAFAGIPFVVVGAGSSFLQHWAEETEGRGRETYRLYAVSNVGSLVGLLAYPLAVEPFVPQTWQWAGLAAAIAIYAAACAAAGIRLRQVESRKSKVESPSPNPQSRIPNPARPEESGEATGRPNISHLPSLISHLLSAPRTRRAALWLALPALSTILLNAATTHITSDVEPMPLMWAVLLAAFLLSYVVGFSRLGERLLPLWGVLATASCIAAAWALGAKSGQSGKFALNLSAVLCLILFGGSFLHACLCRLRPEGALITRYYLCIAAGGAAGGLAAAVLPPLLFNAVAEYPVAVVLLAVAVLASPFSLVPAGLARLADSFRRGAGLREAAVAAAVCLAAFALAMRFVWISADKWIEDSGRSFYGTWKVGRDTLKVDRTGEEIPMKIFMHGGTMHGYEAVDPSRRTGATAYFGELGGGLAFSLNPKYAAGEPVDCAIIGMGVGVMAHYGRKGDRILFYEIDGKVADAARRHFTFVPESKADVPVVLGDARKALEAERDAGAAKHDILVVDAYSGDSIPYHLITRQAFRLYADRLAEGGTLALHVSNWHIDLLPVCKAAAKELGMEPLGVLSQGGFFTMDAMWVFMSKEGLAPPSDPHVDIVDWDSVRDRPLPDDEVGSILPYVHFAK